MIGKLEYTKIFLSVEEKSINEVNIILLMNKIWYSRKSMSTESLQLSDDGLDYLKNTLQLQPYEILLPTEVNSQSTIFLSKYLDCPFYVSYNSLIVFSQKKHMELLLLSNDIATYGLIKALKKV